MTVRLLGIAIFTACVLAAATIAPPFSLAQPAEDLSALNQQVIQLYQAGKYGEATTVAQRALVLAESQLGPDHPSVGTMLNNLAALYDAQGRYARAKSLYKRALAIREKALGPDHPDVGETLNNLAELYRAQGGYWEAEPLYKRALAITEKTLGPDHLDVGTTLNNLALLYEAQGRYREAEPLYKRDLAIMEKALGPDHPRVGTTLNNLAVLYRVQGRYGESEPLSKRDLAIREKALGPEHPSVGTSLNNLAVLYEVQRRYREAEPLYRRALALAEKALGPEHPRVGTSLNNLALLSFVQRDWQQAADYWRRSTSVAVRRTRRGTRDVGKALTGKKESEAERVSYRFWRLIKVAYRLASSERSKETQLGQEMFRTAQWAQGSEAATSLAQMAARGAKGDPKLAALARERQDLVVEWQQRDEVRTAYVSRAPDKRDAKVEAANLTRLTAIDQRIADIDRRLAADFPDYAALANPEPLSVADVQMQLREGEALVLFMDTLAEKPTPEETFIWVVTRTDMRWLRSAFGTKALREKVAALRRALDPTAGGTRAAIPMKGRTAADDFDLALAYELYNELLAPAEDLLQDKPHLIIVPSGPLTALPFHLLVTEESNALGADRYAKAQWLVRRHAITTLPSVASLVSLRRKTDTGRAPKPFIAFADPVFRKAAVTATDIAERKDSATRGLSVYFRGGSADAGALANLMPLPDTAEEVRAIAATFGEGVALRVGTAASETEVKRLPLDQYRVVHFATHGLVAGEVEGLAEPALALTVPETPTDEDDGLLTASEVAELKLNADWLLLSACNTAAGERPGAEALSGLARAFFYAGTRALLVSHWPVYSDAAVKLTTRAFAELRRSPVIGRSEALRRAMLSLLDKGKRNEAHPAYWAPFVVVGEGAAEG